MTTSPLLLGKRAVQAVYPDRAVAEACAKATGLAPLGVPPPAPRTAVPVVVRCAHALKLPDALASAPTVPVRFKQFDSSDPFTLLQGDVRGRPVAVQQSLGRSHAETSLRLVHALQTLWAARAGGCQPHLALHLPASCDPQRDPSAFNRLVATLAKASGARELHFDGEDSAASGVAECDSDAATQAFRPQLAAAHGRERLQALARVARQQSKQAGRRGLADLESAWRSLAQEAALRACRAPSAAAEGCVVFGVQSASALRDAVSQELSKRAGAQVGAHALVDAAHPSVQLHDAVEGKHVVIVTSLRPPPQAQPHGDGPAMNLEALLLVQAARDAGARKITVVHAYQMNSRSDLEAHDPEGATAGAYCDLVARWFEAAGADDAVLVECHDLHTVNSWSGPKRGHAAVVDGVRVLVNDLFATLTPEERRRSVLALPDAGSVKRSKALRPLFAASFEGQKIRTDHEGGCTLQGLGGGRIPEDAIVTLSDDETATGSTLVQMLAMLRERGARTVHALLVHNVLPMDPLQRNLHLAWFRQAGATSLRFSDTHALGPVVRSLDELLALRPDAAQARAEVEAFMAKKGLAGTPEALCDNLAGAVRVVSVAGAVARAIPCEPPTRGLERARALLRVQADFPKPGITFRDMSPVLEDPEARRAVVRALVETVRGLGITQVAAIQSRGYLLGASIADALNCGLLMLRKPGKVPGKLLEARYDLEYGQDTLVVPEGALSANDRVLVVDDLIATGGSANAAVQLVRQSGAQALGVATLLELEGLPGRAKLDVPLTSVFAV